MFITTNSHSFLTADAAHIVPPAEAHSAPNLSDRIIAHAKAIGITGPMPLILQGAS